MTSSTLYDRVKVNTATTGTGTITVGSAVSGYLSFAGGGVSDGSQVSYLIEEGANWEIGNGVYTVSGTTMSRTPIKSSNSNAAISLLGGAVVSLTAFSADICTIDTTQNLSNKSITTGNLAGFTIGSSPIGGLGSTGPSTAIFTTLQANTSISGTGFTTYFASPPAIGGTTAAAGSFTTLSASSTVSGTGFSTYLASPPAIGGTTAAAGSFTTLSASSTVSGTGFSTYLASPPAIGGTTAAAGAFTTLSASSTVSGTGFSTYLASPPAIGGTTAAAITGTTITANTGLVGPHNGTVGATTPNTGSFTTLAASSTVSGTGFSTYLASPPAIGGTAAAAGSFTTVTASTSVLSSGTGGVGYSTGAGVAVTQLTSRTTSTPTTGASKSGAITLFTTTAVVGTYFSFTVPNTGIAVTDTVVLSVRGATNTYVAFVSAITAATSFQVTMASVVGTASDTPIVNFAIIKAVSA